MRNVIHFISGLALFTAGSLIADIIVYIGYGQAYFEANDMIRTSDIIGYATLVAIQAYLIGVFVLSATKVTFHDRSFHFDRYFLVWATVTGFLLPLLFAADYFMHQPISESRLAPLISGGRLPTILTATLYAFLRRKPLI